MDRSKRMNSMGSSSNCFDVMIYQENIIILAGMSTRCNWRRTNPGVQYWEPLHLRRAQRSSVCLKSIVCNALSGWSWIGIAGPVRPTGMRGRGGGGVNQRTGKKLSVRSNVRGHLILQAIFHHRATPRLPLQITLQSQSFAKLLGKVSCKAFSKISIRFEQPISHLPPQFRISRS
jgi:hypothetical protein